MKLTKVHLKHYEIVKLLQNSVYVCYSRFLIKEIYHTACISVKMCVDSSIKQVK